MRVTYCNLHDRPCCAWDLPASIQDLLVELEDTPGLEGCGHASRRALTDESEAMLQVRLVVFAERQ